MNTGRDFVKRIGPLGAALFLILFILVTVMLFTSRGVAVEGYSAPHDSNYYAKHLEELALEIQDNLIPKLTPEGSVTVSTGAARVTVTAGEADLHNIRLAIIHYYADNLFEFIAAE